jgi:Na+/H+-dicarboxylate symporter
LFSEEHAMLPMILFGMIAPIPYQVLACVGVWRSASGRGVLGMLARLIVVVQLIAMLFVFGGLLTLPFKAGSSQI